MWVLTDKQFTNFRMSKPATSTVSVSKNSRGEWQVAWSDSILAKTVDNKLVTDYKPHWVGTVTTDGHILDDRDRDELKTILLSMDCTVIFLEQSSVRDAHYKGFCKQVLWQAFHYVDLIDIQNPAFAFDLDAANDHEKSTGTLHDLRSLWDQVGTRVTLTSYCYGVS